MTDKDFNLDIALAIVSSTSSEFKVDFDDLWQWCGYSRKDSAKRTLATNFEESIDFEIHKPVEIGLQAGYSNREIIILTLDAAKEFAMIAQTDQGRLVRKYFIQAEKTLRTPMSTAQFLLHTAQLLVDIEERQKNVEQRQNVLDNRISAIEQQKLEAESQLREIERSQEKPLKATTRSNINRLVRSFVSVTHVYHQEAWNKLYLELKYRYGYDAKTRARNRGIKPLDCVEQDGMMEKLYAIASEIL